LPLPGANIPAAPVSMCPFASFHSHSSFASSYATRLKTARGWSCVGSRLPFGMDNRSQTTLARFVPLRRMVAPPTTYTLPQRDQFKPDSGHDIRSTTQRLWRALFATVPLGLLPHAHSTQAPRLSRRITAYWLPAYCTTSRACHLPLRCGRDTRMFAPRRWCLYTLYAGRTDIRTFCVSAAGMVGFHRAWFPVLLLSASAGRTPFLPLDAGTTSIFCPTLQHCCRSTPAVLSRTNRTARAGFVWTTLRVAKRWLT